MLMIIGHALRYYVGISASQLTTQRKIVMLECAIFRACLKWLWHQYFPRLSADICHALILCYL
jgi:hypothetical protein